MASKQVPQTFLVPLPTHPGPIIPPPIVPVRPTAVHRHDVYVSKNKRQIPAKPLVFAGFFAAIGTTLGVFQRKSILRATEWTSGHLGDFFNAAAKKASKMRK